MENTDTTIEFYDNFVSAQVETNVNDRIFGLYKRMLKNGLNTKSKVLELGCGIGTLSFLISKTVKRGFVEGVDISPKSVFYAKQKIQKSNFSFYCDDIVKYKPKIQNPEIITLFDVLEHIPLEKHNSLFGNISEFITDQTVLLINIPNPSFIEYDQANDPDVLQEIDQPVHYPFVANSLYDNNLEIIKMEMYSVWWKNDYVFYTVVKRRPFEKFELQKHRTFFQKIPVKLFRLKLKWFYKY